MEALEPEVGEVGEGAELEHFKKIGVYEHVSRNEAMQDFTERRRPE